MKKFNALVLAWALAFAGAVTPANAAGFFTNGVPVAGGVQYPSTIPLTGVEQVPADTQLAAGLNPQSEAVTTLQLVQAQDYLGTPQDQFATATNTTGFTATTAQVVGAKLTVLSLTGTLGAGAALTTPTATAILAALPNAAIGRTYTLRFINNSSANFAWTITAGTGVTVTGTATVAQNTFREYAVTVTAVGTPAVTLQNIGAGTN